MNNLTSNEYWTEISDIATNLVDEAMDAAIEDNNGDYSDFETLKEQAIDSINDYRLHEVIDGHQWIIYYAYSLDVINNSDNEDYYSDNFGAESLAASLEQGGLNTLHCHIAFWCMYADVQDKLDSAFDEYEEKQDAA